MGIINKKVRECVLRADVLIIDRPKAVEAEYSFITIMREFQKRSRMREGLTMYRLPPSDPSLGYQRSGQWLRG